MIAVAIEQGGPLVKEIALADLSPRIFSAIMILDHIATREFLAKTRENLAELKVGLDSLSVAQVTISGPVNAQDQRVLGAILLMVIMWLLVLTAPIAVQESRLPAETQQTLNDYYGLIAGLAITITFLIAPKLMKKTGKK
jgi:hypothetical protein